MSGVLADMVSGTRLRGADMTPLDYRAQGAIIRMTAENLSNSIAAAHLVAYYLPRPIRERVAGGKIELVDRFLDDRVTAVYTVARWLMAESGSHNIRGYMELERQYCARQRSEYRLARLMRMRFDASKAKRAELDVKLDGLREDGLRAVQRKLEAKGLVECEALAS